MTVDKVVADMNTKGAAQTRNALYVDISRAREKAVVYTDDKARLERQTRDFAKKITSADFSERLARMERQQGIRNNDRYHAPENEQQKIEKALRQIKEHTLKYGSGGQGRENILSAPPLQIGQQPPDRKPENVLEPSKAALDMSADIRRIQQERSAARLAAMDNAIKGITDDRTKKAELERQQKIEEAKEKARSAIEKAKRLEEKKVERETPSEPEMDLGFGR